MDIIDRSEIVISRLVIQLGIPHLANKITNEYRNRELVIISILDAAFMFTSDLVRHITLLPMTIKFMKVVSYHQGIPSDPKILTTFEMIDIESKDILIVDTIIDSGNTIRVVKKYLYGLSPKSIKICALVIKNNKNNKDITVDFSHVSNIDGFLFGYGTDYKDGTCRNLPHIYKLKG